RRGARLPQRRLFCPSARPAGRAAGVALARRARHHPRGARRRLVQLHARSPPSALRRPDAPDRGLSGGVHMTSLTLCLLLALQILMGAFDTLYHHELTERLAWRPSQQRELLLHSVRTLTYAMLFLTLAWLAPHGAWAMLAIAIVIAEVVITLMDFVEEDVSRKLPASERVGHTLLALNYGAILMLLVPILGGWAAEATALVPVSYGAWSVLTSIAAAGMAL